MLTLSGKKGLIVWLESSGSSNLFISEIYVISTKFILSIFYFPFIYYYQIFSFRFSGQLVSYSSEFSKVDIFSYFIVFLIVFLLQSFYILLGIDFYFDTVLSLNGDYISFALRNFYFDLDFYFSSLNLSRTSLNFIIRR